MGVDRSQIALSYFEPEESSASSPGNTTSVVVAHPSA